MLEFLQDEVRWSASLRKELLSVYTSQAICLAFSSYPLENQQKEFTVLGIVQPSNIESRSIASTTIDRVINYSRITILPVKYLTTSVTSSSISSSLSIKVISQLYIIINGLQLLSRIHIKSLLLFQASQILQLRFSSLSTSRTYLVKFQLLGFAISVARIPS